MKYVELTESEQLEIIGGKNWTKCYVGTLGSALVGSAGGPVGYWGRCYGRLCYFLLKNKRRSHFSK